MPKVAIALLIVALSGAAVVWNFVAPRDVGGGQTADMTPTFFLELPIDRQNLVLEVTTGPMPRGAELVLMTEDGQPLGSVSIFGVTNTDRAIRHQIVFDPQSQAKGRIAVRAFVDLGSEMRPATLTEFLGVQIAHP